MTVILLLVACSPSIPQQEEVSDFETLITVPVEAGDSPDIAVFPQPGAVTKLARKGYLVPLWDQAIALYDENYSRPGRNLRALMALTEEMKRLLGIVGTFGTDWHLLTAEAFISMSSRWPYSSCSSVTSHGACWPDR